MPPAWSVKAVLSIVRNPTGQQNPKLVELLRKDLFAYSDIESQLTGYDACFFCLGVTSSGLTEQDSKPALANHLSIRNRKYHWAQRSHLLA